MIERLFRRRTLEDPGWYRFVFANLWMAPLWAIVRLYVGWQWLQAGWHKVDGTGWIDHDGSALKAFWQRIVQVPEQGTPPIKFDWYRNFIQHMLDHGWYTWFAWIISFGELFAGIFLIVGAFTGIAAVGAAFMNFNFMLAGSASTNPVLFFFSVLLLLAWKVAGYIGLDRWLLPVLGTPWQLGSVFGLGGPGGRDGPRDGESPAPP
jgi:thiosulfate dehydrogenase [quinone] large subunit